MSLKVSFTGPMAPTSTHWAPLGGVMLILGLLIVSTGLLLALGPQAFGPVLFLQLLLVFGIAFALYLFQRPQVGFALILVGGIFVSREIGTGTQTGLNGAFLLSPVVIGVWLVHLMLRRKDRVPISSRTVLPLYLFMIAAVLALIVGQYPWFPTQGASITAQAAQLSVFLFSGGLFLAAAYQLQDLRWLRRVTFLFIGLGSVHLLVRLIPSVTASVAGALPPAVTMGSMFWTWLVALSFGQAFLNRDLNPMVRLALAGVTATALYLGLTQLSTWVSGWFPAILSVFIIVLVRFPVPVLLASPALAAAALLGATYFTDLATAGDNLYSYDTRVAAFESLLPILRANPLLGVGPANYYNYTALFPILGWYVRFNSHNNYLDLIAQTGLLGLSFFVWFGCAVAITARKLQLRMLGGFERAFVYSVLAGTIATFMAAALGDWVIPFIYNTGFPGYRTSVLPWIFMGGLVALEQQVARRH